MKIIQITDTHLFSNDSSEIFGVKSNITFKKVIDKILTEEIHDTDLIFLTGDISQDETVESYKKVVHHLSNINLPVYWIPGNHDDPVVMKLVFGKAKNFYRKTALTFSHWHFIFLDTKICGREDGYLS